MRIKDLKQDKRNYRKHNQKNLDLIKKSVNEVGLGRSVVIDNENEIICGNGLVSTLDQNTPVRVIETDGSELVVVKRTDLATDDYKRKQLAVMDNSTSDTSDWNIELLKNDFSIDELDLFGLETYKFSDIEEDIAITEDVNFEAKVESQGIIQYNIIFDNKEQQEEWYEFLKYLKNKYPEAETISERLSIIIGQILNG